jgi:hypothetical protein
MGGGLGRPGLLLTENGQPVLGLEPADQVPQPDDTLLDDV